MEHKSNRNIKIAENKSTPKAQDTKDYTSKLAKMNNTLSLYVKLSMFGQMDLADVKTDQFEYHFKHNILKLNVLHFQYRVYITFENQCD